MVARQAADYDPILWLEERLDFQPATSAQFIYDRMESQSSRGLAIIYEPFQAGKKSHFVDRGQILDFAASVGRGRILDFGPGDGWPALLLAPGVEQVVGVDGSARRVAVCQANAVKLGVTNATFIHVPPGAALPFPAAMFDGITAASSVEQTPDVEATLAELSRVLKPGGRLRLDYESLSFYQGRAEKDVWVVDSEAESVLLIYDRQVAAERVRHYALLLAAPRPAVLSACQCDSKRLSYADLTFAALQRIVPLVKCAACWEGQHPSCRTLLAWLHTAGFTSARPTYDGGWLARRLFDHLLPQARPTTLTGTDDYLRPLVETILETEAPATSQPGEWDPWIIANK